ncbi:GT-D fold domain-containing glycosyltransferase [Bacillus thuringiensis]|uniref:GT-D fold domain-containing glycosyltransferase n=1 Tax=Bacillus thuringiensis TaxID=1428 RepID=UPI0025A6680B|nr:GT-D fold domain-containing glycosyltransferase [Bacillus thuringiensis]MDM8365777.1 GT-D fold domain-containing glycosyltransferase [Bacillus thuringiensis]
MHNNAYLAIDSVLQQIDDALHTKKAYSVVRIGDGENIVLSQQHVMTIDEVLAEPWAIKANKGLKGVTLPNLSLRNAMIESIKKANVVGILPYNDTTILAPTHLKRVLTDKVFSYYKIIPAYTCHACINRQLVKDPRFWEIVKEKRILIIYQFADQLKDILQNEPYTLNITMTIPFSDYSQIPNTLEKLKTSKDQFDMALICCGVNAVILAQKVAEVTGKVGLDFGKAANILIKGTPN